MTSADTRPKRPPNRTKFPSKIAALHVFSATKPIDGELYAYPARRRILLRGTEAVESGVSDDTSGGRSLAWSNPGLRPASGHNC